jgi:hypothetical protein
MRRGFAEKNRLITGILAVRQAAARFLFATSLS